MKAAGDENRFGRINVQYSEERLENVWEVGVRIMSRTSQADENKMLNQHLLDGAGGPTSRRCSYSLQRTQNPFVRKRKMMGRWVPEQ